MGMIDNVITNLVGEDLKGDRDYEFRKWSGTFAAANGSIYGIPSCAGRVAKFNPINKSMARVGPDFGDGYCKWIKGAITDKGVIYCLPRDASKRGILKIDTNTDTATELDRNLLPERGLHQGESLWLSCAAALDGCIYFMPGKARRIMKLDPNNGDAISSVGDDLEYGECKYIGTVVGIDGCVYGIPNLSNHVTKYDPINDITSFVGEETDTKFCDGNGVLGRDGCIYALANGGVLKIDTVNNSHCFVGNIMSNYCEMEYWDDAILGIDGCIYWPPCDSGRTLKYDPNSDQTSLVGDDFENYPSDKWLSGALAPDGVIYCIPTNANQVLAIDPIGEFLATTKANMQEHPEEFGAFFKKTIKVDHALDEDLDEDSYDEDSDEESTLSVKFGSLFQTSEADDDSVLSITNFDLAVVKFGQNKVFEVLAKSMKPVNDYCKESNLCPFMIAASYKESPLCAIYYLLCRNLSWVPKNKQIRTKKRRLPV